MLLIADIGAKNGIPVLIKTSITPYILAMMVVMFIAPQVSRNQSEHVPAEVVPAVLIQTLHRPKYNPAVIARVVHPAC